MIEKLQRFLKNKHKFERKLDIYEILELLDTKYKNFREAVNSEKKDDVKKALSNFMVEMIKYCNSRDIEIQKILEEDFNL